MVEHQTFQSVFMKICWYSFHNFLFKVLTCTALYSIELTLMIPVFFTATAVKKSVTVIFFANPWKILPTLFFGTDIQVLFYDCYH